MTLPKTKLIKKIHDSSCSINPCLRSMLVLVFAKKKGLRCPWGGNYAYVHRIRFIFTKNKLNACSLILVHQFLVNSLYLVLLLTLIILVLLRLWNSSYVELVLFHWRPYMVYISFLLCVLDYWESQVLLWCWWYRCCDCKLILL